MISNVYTIIELQRYVIKKFQVVTIEFSFRLGES